MTDDTSQKELGTLTLGPLTVNSKTLDALHSLLGLPLIIGVVLVILGLILMVKAFPEVSIVIEQFGQNQIAGVLLLIFGALIIIIDLISSESVHENDVSPLPQRTHPGSPNEKLFLEKRFEIMWSYVESNGYCFIDGPLCPNCKTGLSKREKGRWIFKKAFLICPNCGQKKIDNAKSVEELKTKIAASKQNIISENQLKDY